MLVSDLSREDAVAYEVGRICAQGLNKIVIKEDKDKRGRKQGEVAELLKKAILKNKSDCNLKVCLDEVEALEYAVNISKKGDIIIVFYEDLKSLIDFINDNDYVEKYENIYKG